MINFIVWGGQWLLFNLWFSSNKFCYCGGLLCQARSNNLFSSGLFNIYMRESVKERKKSEFK